MANKEQRGILNTAKRLACFVSRPGSDDGIYQLFQYSILNSNEATAQMLKSEFNHNLQSSSDEILRREYGISPNYFTLSLVRLIAFTMIRINTKNAGISWYESPLFSTIKKVGQ